MRSLADEVPFDIPDSWEWVRLGSIVYNRGQITPSTDFCYIDIGSIDNKKQKLNPTDTVIAPDKAPSRARKLVDKGDVLYSTVRPYLHNMCIVDRDFSCIPIASTGFAVLTCHAELCNKFLFYYMMSPDFDAYANNTDNAKGVAYPAINDDRLYKALIPIPPLGEQFRIVSAIESVDASIRDYGAKEEALRALNGSFPEGLKKSILQEAVQGKLVPQDPSDEPAEALLERIRAEKQRLIKEGKIKKDKHESVIFRRDNSHYEKLDGMERCIDDELPFEIPENWCWAQLGSISSYAETKQKINAANADSDIWGLDLEDIEKGGRLIVRKTVGERKAIGDKTVFSKGDILYSKLRPYLLKILVAPECGICTPEIVPFQMYGGIVSEYIVNFLRSPYVDNLINSITYGVKMPRVGTETMTTLFVPVPPLAEQRRIVQRIEELLPLVKGL